MDHKSWTLPVKKVPAPQKVDRSVVWNNVHLCYEQKLFGQVTCVRYNNAGTMVGCASTNQLTLLRVPQTEGVVSNEQREKKCFSIRFRDDDKMALQSLDHRVVVRSTQTSFERQFSGHLRDVRDAIFLGRHNFASGSDDTTVRLWDIMNESELAVSNIHTDYVRCLENSSSGCFFSGSYDHTINMWDTRVGLSHPTQTTARSVENPVESLLRIRENLLACGSGDHIVLFDLRKGLSSPVLQVSHHTKAVVALAFSEKHNVLLSGSLDQRVRMFSMEGGSLMTSVASKKFSEAVTAVAVHPFSSEFAVGTAEGDLRILKLESGSSDKQADKEEGDREGEAHEDEEEEDQERSPEEKELKRDKEKFFVTKMQQVQQLLLSYRYNRSLKTALYSRSPDVVVSTLEELIRRGALHVALSGQIDRTIVQILRFSINHIDQPQFYESMMIVLDTIFEIYGTSVGKSDFLHREMMIAHRRLGSMLATLQRMEKTLSLMELIVNDY